MKYPIIYLMMIVLYTSFSISLDTVWTIQGHKGGISDVRLSEDGEKIYTSGADGKINIWDADSGNLLDSLVFDNYITSFCLNEKDSILYIAFISQENDSFKIVEYNYSKPNNQIRILYQSIFDSYIEKYNYNTIEFFKNKGVIVIGIGFNFFSGGGSFTMGDLWYYDIKTKEITKNLNNDKMVNSIMSKKDNSEFAFSSFYTYANSLGTGGAFGGSTQIRIIDSSLQKTRTIYNNETYLSYPSEILYVAYSNNSKYLIASTSIMTYLWESENYTELIRYYGSLSAFSYNNEFIISCYDSYLSIYKILTHYLIEETKIPDNLNILKIIALPDSIHFITTGNDGKIAKWKQSIITSNIEKQNRIYNFNIYQQDNNSNILIEFYLNDFENINISIFNVLGQEVYRAENLLYPGYQTITVDTYSLQNGCYFLKLITQKNSITKNIFITK